MATPEELLQQLAQACRILEMEGHGDMTLGHVSLRDPGGRGFWLKRNRIGLGEVLGPQDFILVGFDGHKREGEGGLNANGLEGPRRVDLGLRQRRGKLLWRARHGL